MGPLSKKRKRGRSPRVSYKANALFVVTFLFEYSKLGKALLEEEIL